MKLLLILIEASLAYGYASIDRTVEAFEYSKTPVYQLPCWGWFDHRPVSPTNRCLVYANRSILQQTSCQPVRTKCVVDQTRQSRYDRAFCSRAFYIENQGNQTEDLKIYLEATNCISSTFTLMYDRCKPECRVEIKMPYPPEQVACCCYTPDCNKEFYFDFVYPNNSKKPVPNYVKIVSPLIVVLLLTPVAFLAMLFIHRRQWYYDKSVSKRFRFRKRSRRRNSDDSKQKHGDYCSLNCDKLQLVGPCGRGHFGCIYRAVTVANGKAGEATTENVPLSKEQFAVKVFGKFDRESWNNEKRVMKMLAAQPESANHILRFLFAERRKLRASDDSFWIVTEYHPMGSLYNYLCKNHGVTLHQLSILCCSLVKGLAYIHSNLPPKKHPLAHRDFNSKNVLMCQDFSVRIADFGLALLLDSKLGEVHSQVGTPRYMAPEVLEGAISFKPMSFLRIDVYALSLVLWELVTCCTELIDPIERCTYQLPFAAAVQHNPTVEQMKEVVVDKQRRPSFPPLMQKHEVGSVLMDTIRDCWDQDADARLSLTCVSIRLEQLFDKALADRGADAVLQMQNGDFAHDDERTRMLAYSDVSNQI